MSAIVGTVISQVRLHTPPGKLVIGFSAGVDSMVLADAVSRAFPQRAPHLVLVDHGHRPIDEAERAAKTFASERSLSLSVERVTVVKDGQGWEAAARDARYRALLGHTGDGTLLLAHTASDQAETVLMRLIRGDDWAALSGIPQARKRICRPLLALSRAQVKDYAAATQLVPVDDPTNEDRSFFRNRVRHDIMPMLAAENPRIIEALCRLAASSEACRDSIEDTGAKLLAAARSASGVSVSELAASPAVVRRQAIAQWLVSLSPQARHPTVRAVSAVEKLCQSTEGTQQIDVSGMQIERAYAWLRPRRPAEPSRVTVHRAPVGSIVRLWQPGDRIRLPRLGGKSRKLADIYVDNKVPRRLRPTLHVLELKGQILWAEGVGAAYGASVDVTVDDSKGRDY